MFVSSWVVRSTKEESAPGSMIQYVAVMETPIAQSVFSASRTGM